MRRTVIAGAALALAVLAPWCVDGLGGTGTSTLTARVAVASNCTIATRGIVFGAYDPIVANRTTDLNATGSITIACTKGIAPTIALGPGNNAAGATRRMAGGTGDFLVYQLYQPPGTAAGTPCSFPGARVWGGTAADLFSTSMTDNKLSRTYNVCGTIRSGQNPAVGNYSDVVVATVTF